MSQTVSRVFNAALVEKHQPWIGFVSRHETPVKCLGSSITPARDAWRRSAFAIRLKRVSSEHLLATRRNVALWCSLSRVQRENFPLRGTGLHHPVNTSLTSVWDCTPLQSLSGPRDTWLTSCASISGQNDNNQRNPSPQRLLFTGDKTQDISGMHYSSKHQRLICITDAALIRQNSFAFVNKAD